jgi:hypothetical protein
MNNPFSGGWRFGDRPTSVEALYQPKPIDNDFLRKVAALQNPEKQGLLDQAVTATPLTGLLEAPGSSGWGNDRDQRAEGPTGPASGPSVMSEAGNPMTQVSGAGYAPNMANAGKGFAALGPLGLLGGLLGGQRLAPVYDLIAPGMNGMMGNDYGMSSTLSGPPDAQQAQAVADSFARDFAGYQPMNGPPNEQQARALADSFAAQMAMSGYGGYGGSAGDSFGGYGGFGAGDYGDGTDR